MFFVVLERRDSRGSGAQPPSVATRMLVALHHCGKAQGFPQYRGSDVDSRSKAKGVVYPNTGGAANVITYRQTEGFPSVPDRALCCKVGRFSLS